MLRTVTGLTGARVNCGVQDAGKSLSLKCGGSRCGAKLRGNVLCRVPGDVQCHYVV